MTSDDEAKRQDLVLPGAAPKAKGKAARAALQRVDENSAVALLAAVPAEEVWLESIDSERTRLAYKSDVRQFISTLAIQSSDELYAVTPTAVIAWRRKMSQPKDQGGLGLKRTTIRRKLSALSSLYEHLVEEDLIDFNPVQQVKRPGRTKKDRKGKTPPLVQEDARALLNAPPLTEATTKDGVELTVPLAGIALIRSLRDRAILSLGFQNGLRRSEIAHLTAGCIVVGEEGGWRRIGPQTTVGAVSTPRLEFLSVLNGYLGGFKFKNSTRRKSMPSGALRPRGCRVAGLQGCRVAGLQGCRVAGLHAVV